MANPSSFLFCSKVAADKSRVLQSTLELEIAAVVGNISSSTYFCTSLPTYLVFKFYNKYYSTIIMVHFSLIILTKRYFGKFSIIIRSNKAKMAQEALSSGLRIISEAHFLDNNYHHFFWFFFANNKNNWFPNPRHFLREKTSHKSYHQLIADFLGETFTGRRDPVQQSLIEKKICSMLLFCCGTMQANILHYRRYFIFTKTFQLLH